MDAYSEAIRLNPHEASYYVFRGSIKFDRHDFEGALADVYQTIQMQPQGLYTYYLRAAARRYSADFNGAIADYEMYYILSLMIPTQKPPSVRSNSNNPAPSGTNGFIRSF